MRKLIQETVTPVEPLGVYLVRKIFQVDDGYEITTARSDDDIKPYTEHYSTNEAALISLAILSSEANKLFS